MGTRNRAAIVVWSPLVIVTATGLAWSLAPMLAAREPGALPVAREPDALPVARKADRDAPLARKGDYLIQRVMSPPDLAARWVPLAPAVKVDGALPNEGLPSIEGPPPPDPPSSAASRPVRAEATPRHRAEATPRHRARVHHDRDLCAAQGMRREDTYQDNHWRSWRCVS